MAVNSYEPIGGWSEHTDQRHPWKVGGNLDWNTGPFLYCTKAIPRQNELPHLSRRLLSFYFGFECSSLTLKQIKTSKINDSLRCINSHMSIKTKNRLSQVSHHGCISMFTTCEYTRPIFKKKCSKQYKTKTYTINLTHKKMLITCELRSSYFYESVIARKNRRYVWWPRAATQNFSFSKIE